jgi:arylsulfatase A-like enzyme
MRNPTRLVTVVGLAAALSMSAPVRPARTAAARPRNLLVITLDTMRADRLPPYGFCGVATPALDRLAAEGVVFEQTFAAVPLTLPSHGTIFTGLYPPRLGVRDNAGAPLAGDVTTMAEVLKDRGLTTAAFVASSVLAAGRGLEQGFGSYSDGPPPRCSGTPRGRRPADGVVDDAIDWLGRQGSTPFFAWIHLYDTHRPYDLPDEYLRLYADPYLAAIAFLDTQIARVIGSLDTRGHLDDTLIVIVGDHGESLGDHGETSHGLFVYQEALHVPFIVRGAGIAPRRVRAVTRLVDVMPTVLEIFGLPHPGMDGVSLAGLAAGTTTDLHLEVYAESLYPQRFGWAPLRSLRTDRYKVIEAPRPELYDLASDPYEARNIFDERRTVGRAMLDRLGTFDEGGERTSSRPLPVDRAVAERIAALGYVHATAGQMPGSPGEQADPKDRVAAFNRMTSVGSFSRAECASRAAATPSPGASRASPYRPRRSGLPPSRPR